MSLFSSAPTSMFMRRLLAALLLGAFAGSAQAAITWDSTPSSGDGGTSLEIIRKDTDATLSGQYIGINAVGTEPNLYLEAVVGGTEFTLDATEAAVHFVGGTSGSFTGYWYVNFLPGTADGTFQVNAYNGDPGAGGTLISTSPVYTITSVDADQGALANKIDRVIINGTEVHPTAGTASIQIGQAFDVVAEYLVNSSNKIENLRVDVAASEGFDPDNTRLLGTEVTTFVDTGFTTPIATRFDQLYFKPTDPSMSAVRATFTFVTIGNAAVNLSPIVAAHSGQYKYNADFNDYNINIAAPTNQVTLSKSVVGATYANPGPGTFDYAVTFNNPTAVPVVIDKIVDVMPSSPANGTYAAASVLFAGGATGEPTQSGQTLTFPGPFEIPAGSTTTALTYQLTMPDTDGVYVNSATALINGNVIDTSADMNSSDPATATVVIGPNADLQITKTDGLTTIEQGNALEYTITVSNPSGPTTATNVIVTDAVAAELTSPEYSLDGGTNFFPWSGSLDIGTVAVGASTSLLLRGTVDGAFTGVTTNTASVSTAGLADPVPANNTASDETTVTAPVTTSILGVAKQATINPTNSLEVTLDFYLTNHGTEALTDVSVPDDLDAVFGAGNYAVTAPQMIPTDDPGTITLNPSFNGSGADTDLLVPASSSLASGATAQFKIVVLVGTVTDQGYGLGLYRNQVTAAALDPLSAVVTDLSDSGALTDADGDGDPTESIATGGNSDENEVTVFAATDPLGPPPLEVVLTKSVVDLNGGDVGPGDTLRYTLNVDNAVTSQVTNLTVTDNLPAGLESYSLVASPAGSSAVFTSAPGGTNGNGVLDVSNLTIAANTGVEIIFDTVVGASVLDGAVIDNIADLDYPAGTNDSDNAQVTVVAPILPASGTKPLYMTTGNTLSRAPLTGNVAAVPVGKSGGTRQWLLSPVTTDTLTLSAGTIPVYLWLAGDKTIGNYPITVSLSSTGGTATAIGTPVSQTLALPKNVPGPTQYQFDIVVPSDVTLAPNSQIVVTIVNDFAKGLLVTPLITGTHSRVEPFSTTVIRVDSVDTLDAAYPGGVSASTFYANDTMYIRTVVADPFGQADISDALVELRDSTGATVIGPVSMGAAVTNDAGTRTYEYAYTFAGPGVVDVGNWKALVTGVEGSEGTVTHSALAEFAVGDVQSDFGDAPDAAAGSGAGDYRTRLVDDGARHELTTDLWLGAGVDAELDGFGAGVAANGDDLDNVDDEDGVTFSTLNSPGLNASVSVQAFNGSGSAGYLNAWIDFDGNGIFNGVDEQIATDLLVASGTVAVNYTVPAAAPLGTTYARFRYSAQTGLGPFGAAATGEVEDYQVTIEVPGYSIAGRVYDDPNVNGLFDAGDTGLTDVGIVLRDVLGGTCVATRTDGDGNYAFAPVLDGDYVLYESVSASVPVPASCPPTTVDPSGYLSVTPNEIVLSVAAADITGQDFADVRTPVLTSDNSASGEPGSALVYPHVFTARADGSVDFTVAAAPVATDWSTLVYRDINCDARLDSSDPVLGGSLAVAADDRICLLVKVFIGGDAAAGERQVSTLTASYTFADPLTLGHGLSSVRQRNDVTTATEPAVGKLVLGKTVENVSEGGAKLIANAADTGDVLRYTVTFENTGAGSITELRINDATPGFTSAQTPIACPPTLPASLSSCTVQVPVALDNVAGYEGYIEWSFGGALAAGAGGALSFDVIVE